MKTCLNTGGKLVQELKQRGTTLTRELEYVSPISLGFAFHVLWLAQGGPELSKRLPAKWSCVYVREDFGCLQPFVRPLSMHELLACR